MIVIVDYGMGNLRSVSKALERLGTSVRITADPQEIERATKLVLPGVGAFDAAMRELAARRLIESIRSFLASGKPYLGICLGLQLLFESSEEGRSAPGLGVLRGTVKRLAATPPLKIPHMGWNQIMSTQHGAVSSQQSAVSRENRCPLLSGIPDGSFFYFVHSYYADPVDRTTVALESDYGQHFAAMVWSKNLFATQFHPEKSQSVGLKLLENFVKL
ncbi:MAG: imidazole glycerol phosphate synthase subunit HisH [Candidatus Omnitrophica bacterium]|nr:imidazole glycerol phosphate synthase subunit HisH [Candidatus Omnitrophota bacterium]